MTAIKDRWEDIKFQVRKEYELTDVSYTTWIEPLKFHKVEGDLVYILIPMDQAHALTYITNKYKDFFKVQISEIMDHSYDVCFILEKDADSDSSDLSSPVSKRTTYNINSESAHLNPRYTFDSFVVGSNNKFAHSASLAVAESPGEAYNPLYIYGNAGLGKTHLMHSIGHYILNENPNTKVLYVTSETFMNEIIDSIRGGSQVTMTKLREKYRNVDVLLIDDIQFIIGKESTQEEFFHTFNVLQAAGKQIVISSDKPPKELKNLEDRYRTRFEWGLIADIQPPDYETRMAILKKKAENYDNHIDDEILQYIANNIVSNIRELEGAFNKVIAMAKLMNSTHDITLELAENALRDVINPKHGREITPSMIVEVVSEHFSISTTDIVSKKRNKEYVIPRHIIMYLCQELTDISLEAIANTVGKKDHTTAMNGIDNIKEKYNNDPEIRNTVDIIRKKLTSY